MRSGVICRMLHAVGVPSGRLVAMTTEALPLKGGPSALGARQPTASRRWCAVAWAAAGAVVCGGLAGACAPMNAVHDEERSG